MRVLYSSGDVRREVRRLFQQGRRRRVAIAAFVGETAETYLRRPKGIELYCWNAPGTNPEAVRHLRDKLGVKCFFIDRLHMKVYFADGVGFVVTSANLSSYALAGGRLKEAGVLLDDGTVSIDKFLDGANPVKATDTRLDELRRRVSATKRTFSDRSKAVSFSEWFYLPSAQRSAEPWRLCPYDWYGDLPLNERGKKVGREQYGKREPFDIMECNGDLAPETFTLTVRVLPSGGLTDWHWMLLDDVLPYTREERKEYSFSHQAIQWYSLSRYRPAPFRLDVGFKTAFAAAAKEIPKRRRRWLNTEATHKLPAPLLADIAERYRKVTNNG